MTNPRGRRQRLALLLGSLTLALALGEAGVRVLGVDAPRADLGVVPHARWHHWHRADHAFDFLVAAEGHTIPVRFNAEGMRDSRVVTRAKPPGTLRVAVVGDSFVEAMQVAEEEGIARRLETHLTAEIGRPVEVLNFGCSGFSTTLELVLVRELVQGFAPDLVVCLHHFSDVSEDWSFAANAERVDGHVRAVPASVGEGEFAMRRTLESSQFYRVARAASRRGPRTRSGESPSYKQTFDAVVHEPYTADDEEAWAYSLAALGDMAAELRQSRIPFAVALIPISTQVEPVDADYAQRLGFAYLAAGERLTYDGYQRKVAGYCREQGIDCLDLLPHFRSANPEGTPRLYLLRDLHWSAAGHDLAARVIAGHARRFVRDKPL
jgi:hypothetical protein